MAGPLILLDAYVEVNGVDLSCLCEAVDLRPETTVFTVKTFTDVVDYPSAVKWHFTAKFAQSYDTGGTAGALGSAWDAWATSRVPCPFTVTAHAGQPTGPDNPTWSGTMVPQPVEVVGGTAGTLSEVDIDWACLGAPTVTTS
jgi:hypothetical protein